MKIKVYLSALCLMASVGLGAQNLQNYNNHPTEAFFRSERAQQIGDQVLLWQRVTGGWPKNVDMVQPMTDSLRREVAGQKMRRNDSTTDNGATLQQMTFLAHLYHSTGEMRFRDAFLRGVDYLLSGQYSNGGWPQFWPEKRDYQWHITYNDDAMVGTMILLRDVAAGKGPFDGDLTSKKLRKRLRKAFRKGVECILNTQIMVNGRPTIWCQQHDHKTLLPAKARAYELPSFGTAESVYIVQLLMELPHPSRRIRKSIEGAMEWFGDHRLTGIRVESFRGENGQRDVRVVDDKNARPLWARFYDLEKAEPLFCDRDGIPRKQLSEVGQERRAGYSWYNDRPARLFPLYEKWKQQHGVKNGL